MFNAWAELTEAVTHRDGGWSHGSPDWTEHGGDSWGAVHGLFLNTRNYVYIYMDRYYNRVLWMLIL